MEKTMATFLKLTALALTGPLRSATAEALAVGVFGAPFFGVDGEPFWGQDRLPMIEAWLREGSW
jgi:2-hydroxychromene-2-carboxylate isomerase